jgi:LysR family nod box-dependent transcriptional activator
MRLNRLDLNLLVTLDALLTERSITRAAERIHLSQPATSGALARLRDVFEDELLVRVGAQMQPTPLGESLQAPVHNILMQIQATVDRRLDFNAEQSERRFRLLLSDYTSNTLMTHVSQRISKVAPKVQLEFIAPTNNPAERLEQGEVDFLIMPSKVLSKGHPSFDLFEEKFVCMCWDQSSIDESNFTLKEFLARGHVTVMFGNHRSESQDQVLMRQQFGVEPKIEVVTSTFMSIPQFIAGTERVCTIYYQLAKLWAQYLPLKILPHPVDLPTIQWGIQWHKFRDLDPGVQWLRNEIKISANELFADTAG